MKTRFCEVLKDIESAKKFCKLNKISPDEVIILWYEDSEVENEKK